MLPREIRTHFIVQSDLRSKPILLRRQVHASKRWIELGTQTHWILHRRGLLAAGQTPGKSVFLMKLWNDLQFIWKRSAFFKLKHSEHLSTGKFKVRILKFVLDVEGEFSLLEDRLATVWLRKMVYIVNFTTPTSVPSVCKPKLFVASQRLLFALVNFLNQQWSLRLPSRKFLAAHLHN